MRTVMTLVSLVSGASRGLGFATASALAGPDHHIIAVARTVGGLVHHNVGSTFEKRQTWTGGPLS